MWQLLFAAAVAGSTGLAAKHLFTPKANLTSDHNHGGKYEEYSQEDQEEPRDSIACELGSPVVPNGCEESRLERNSEGIFRFSSSGSAGEKARRSKKKSGIPSRRLKYSGNNESVKRRSGHFEVSSGRKFAVCLKKRRTSKCVPGKCRSCATKDSSLFNWGLGVGIMCMMSTGKSEINKLSTAMDETSKVVQELKTELYKRKAHVAASTKLIDSTRTQPQANRLSIVDRDIDDIKVVGHPTIDDIECPSSVLTEEPEPDVLEMVQLEAELESELQKLPWSTGEPSGLSRPNFGTNGVSSQGFHELEARGHVSDKCQGVPPSELDQKLCHLLIEQQENQIEELESELQLSQKKLQQKEAELQALKNCVRGLTELSLSTISDDEPAVQEQEDSSEWDSNSNLAPESRISTIGMKRSIDYA